jgi:hypothetical protein
LDQKVIVCRALPQLNGVTHTVKVLTPFSFSIGDTTSFGKFSVRARSQRSVHV